MQGVIHKISRLVIYFFNDEKVRIQNGLIVNNIRVASDINDDYTIEEVPMPAMVVGGVYAYEGMYIIANQEAYDIALDSIKTSKKSEIKKAFFTASDKPIVDTGLGFSVDGAYKNKTDFETGKKYNFPKVRASDNLDYPVTSTDYDTIITAIEMNGIGLYQKKWTLEAQIDSATTVEELELIAW